MSGRKSTKKKNKKKRWRRKSKNEKPGLDKSMDGQIDE